MVKPNLSVVMVVPSSSASTLNAPNEPVESTELLISVLTIKVSPVALKRVELSFLKS